LAADRLGAESLLHGLLVLGYTTGIMKKVYVETSIFSFYYDRRTAASVTARRTWTREWWGGSRKDYDAVTSVAVLAELEKGTLQHRRQALNLAMKLPAISVGEDVADIVTVYIEHHVMPRNPTGDALHLALASLEKCDYLVTWNCEHLANANKFGHIRRVNTMLGLHVPLLVTPLELMG
jgi:predicted nucleic acid-binding protein